MAPKKKKDTGPDLYGVLSLSRDATLEDVKKSYRKLALQCHPDKCPGDQAAHERFQTLSEAYSVLSDPKKRKYYDETGTIEGLDISQEEFMDMFQSLLLEIIGGVDMIRDMLACFTPRELSRLPPFPFPKELFPQGTFPPGLRFSSKGLKGMPPQIEELIQSGDLHSMFAAMSHGPPPHRRGRRGKAAAAAARGGLFGGAPRDGSQESGSGQDEDEGEDDGTGSDSDSDSDWTEMSDADLEELLRGSQLGGAPEGPVLREPESPEPPSATGRSQPGHARPTLHTPASSRHVPDRDLAGSGGCGGSGAGGGGGGGPVSPRLVRDWMAAARGCDMDAMAALLAAEPGLLGCRGSGLGHTALHWCAAKGSVEGVAWLLQQGLDVNVRNEDGATPLHAAARNGQLEAVEALLGWGRGRARSAGGGGAQAVPAAAAAAPAACDPWAIDGEGRTALHLAREYGHSQVAAALLHRTAGTAVAAPADADVAGQGGSGTGVERADAGCSSGLQLGSDSPEQGRISKAKGLRGTESVGQVPVDAAAGPNAAPLAAQGTGASARVPGAQAPDAVHAAPASGPSLSPGVAAVPSSSSGAGGEASAAVGPGDVGPTARSGAGEAAEAPAPLGAPATAVPSTAASSRPGHPEPHTGTPQAAPQHPSTPGATQQAHGHHSSAGPSEGPQQPGCSPGLRPAQLNPQPAPSGTGSSDAPGGSGRTATPGRQDQASGQTRGAGAPATAPAPAAAAAAAASSSAGRVPQPQSPAAQPGRKGLSAEEKAARRAALLAADAAAEQAEARKEADRAKAAEAAALAAGARSRTEGRAWLDAARGGDLAALQRMLRANPRLLQYQGQGTNYGFTSHTALHWAAARGHTAAARWLLTQGAHPDALNAAGATPLHAAAGGGCADCMRLLVLEAGAAMQVTDSEGETARDILLRRAAAEGASGGGGGPRLAAELDLLGRVAALRDADGGPGGPGWSLRVMRGLLAAAGALPAGLLERRELAEACQQLIARHPPRIVPRTQAAAPPPAPAAAGTAAPGPSPPSAAAATPGAAAGAPATAPATAPAPPQREHKPPPGIKTSAASAPPPPPAGEAAATAAGSGSAADPASAAVDAAKRRGNEAFAAGNFSKAVSAYTMAMRLCTAPSAVLHSNRSAAYSGMSYYGKAQADAEEAVRLEPGQPKYRSRLGTALLGQRQLREAAAAFTAALQLQPAYPAAAQGLEDVRAAQEQDRAAGMGG